MVTDALNGAGSSEVSDHSASNGAADLVLVAKGTAGDAKNLGDLEGDLVPSLLVKEHIVVKLISGLYLGPGLLLGLGLLLGGVHLLGGDGTLILSFGVFASRFSFSGLHNHTHINQSPIIALTILTINNNKHT